MLGIDVSKDTLACTLFDPQSQRPLWSRTFDNSDAGIARLLRQTPPQASWVMEPTGRYSTTIAKLAQQAGRTVLLAQPKAARHFLKSIQSRAKTDALDSHGLGLFALCHQTRLRPYPLKTPMLEQLDQLLNARKSLSQSLAAFQMRAVEMPHAEAALQPVIAALQQQKQELDRQLAQLTTAPQDTTDANATDANATDASTALPGLAAVKVLQEVPGIGPVTAATAVSRLSSRRFAHSDQFVAYCGLDIGVRQSGKRQGDTGLTKQGDAELRRLFYLAAQSNLRMADSPFKAQYERERAKGLSSTAALCAVARKLARLCWSLFTHDTRYDPQRVYQQHHSKGSNPETPPSP